jgi:uncharacterized protein YndB with AHSA1/START domain
VADLFEGIVLATVEIAATAERVFEALASKEIVQWWGLPGVFDAREWDGEVHVGGRWRACGLNGKGETWTLEGEFLHVDRPVKLTHTWHTPGSDEPPSMVTYLLEPIDGGTRVTLRHTGITQKAACTGACMGWESCLSRLGAQLGLLNT